MGAVLKGRTSELEAFSSWLNFVGELWLAPPEAKHRQGLAALAQLFPEHAEALLPKDPDAFRQSWFSHLRVPGPQNLLPYETSHLPPEVTPRGAERLAQVAGLYAAAGFALEPFSHEPADHLGQELRFVAALVARLAASVAAGSDDGRDHVRSWVQGFCRDHVGVWLPRFVAHAGKVSLDPFFPALAAVSWELVGSVPDG